MAVSVRMLRTRALGLAFLAVLAFLLWLSIAFYNHTFTPVVPVTLQVDNVGHQLDTPADVKLRGIIVGTVTGIHSNGSYGTLDLALQPDKVKLIPANVQAEILPKTLFGEKFVDLIIPAAAAANPIGAHAVIGLDRSSTAIETEKVFNDLVPLLDTLQPVQLNMTLSNLAEALRGRGNQLGDNLARTDTYFSALNPDLHNIETDISGLADLAANYDAATPNLLATLSNASTNARTLVAKGDVFTNFLAGTSGFADEATNVLTRNENNLVQLAAVSEPTLALLARYSPEFPCLMQGFVNLEPRLNGAFAPADSSSKPQLHVRLQTVPLPPSGPGYTAKDRPDYALIHNPHYSGPHCYGLPNFPTTPNVAVPPLNGPEGAGTASNEPPSSAGGPTSTANTAARLLAAPDLGVNSANVPDLAAVLLAPQLAGSRVSLS